MFKRMVYSVKFVFRFESRYRFTGLTFYVGPYENRKNNQQKNIRYGFHRYKLLQVGEKKYKIIHNTAVDIYTILYYFIVVTHQRLR